MAGPDLVEECERPRLALEGGPDERPHRDLDLMLDRRGEPQVGEGLGIEPLIGPEQLESLDREARPSGRWTGIALTEDAAAEPRAKPRMWSVHHREQLVGFVMISDGIGELDDDLVGPYYLWRLLIDERFQGRGYGAATIDAVVDYLRGRPDASVLWTSCAAGDGSPQPFYLRYGFVRTGDVKWDEDLLRLDLDASREDVS